MTESIERITSFHTTAVHFSDNSAKYKNRTVRAKNSQIRRTSDREWVTKEEFFVLVELYIYFFINYVFILKTTHPHWDDNVLSGPSSKLLITTSIIDFSIRMIEWHCIDLQKKAKMKLIFWWCWRKLIDSGKDKNCGNELVRNWNWIECRHREWEGCVV